MVQIIMCWLLLLLVGGAVFDRKNKLVPKLAAAGLFLLGNNVFVTTCRAFTTTPQSIITSTTTTSAVNQNIWFRSSQLLYADNSNHVDAEFRSLESECVARIRSCSSIQQIYLTMEESVADVKNSDDTSRRHKVTESLPEKTKATIKSMTPNVAAAALRRMTQLDCSEDVATMWTLVNHLVEIMERPDQEELSLTRYALLDVVSSLAFLEKKRNVKQLHKGAQIQQLSQIMVQRMNQNRELVLETSSAKLVDTLYALNVLGFGRATTDTGGFEESWKQHHSKAVSIQNEICEKLVQGHYLGKMSPGDMSIALTTLATATMQPFRRSAESTLAIALMRRFRKQAVRQSATTRQLVRALQAVAEIGGHAKERMAGVEDNNKLNKEAQLMAYTVFKEIIQRPQSPQDKNNNALTLKQVTDMVSSVSSMNVLKNADGDGDAPFRTLWGSFLERQSDEIVSHASVEQISRFTRTVEASQSKDMALPPQIMQRVGDRFLEEVSRLIEPRSNELSHNSYENCSIDPKSANAILRCATLSWGHNATVMKPFQKSAHLLFTNDDFLERSQAPHLANYMSFLEKSRYNAHELGLLAAKNVDPLVAVGARILEDDVSNTVTPAQASRILSSFTSVTLTRAHNREAGVDDFNKSINKENIILPDLFHNLGGHLLTSSSEELSPRDISSALCAYAKASYGQDMGIFDHLAEVLAARVDDCSIRQVTQSLWACGKMTAWEVQQDQQQLEADTAIDQHEAPPYLPSAEKFATFLSQRQYEMTSKDVAQTIWALGRLESVQNPHDYGTSVTADVFLSRATKLASQLTSPEIANILWGMSRTGWRDCGSSVQSFTDRLLDLHHSPSEKATPQEAANVMLALGRMNVVNEEVLEALSNDILDQIDTASAQAIANALWAHRALHLTPPRKLLDRWAVERLGLGLAVQPYQKP